MGGAKTACPPVDTNSQLSSSACRHVTSADDIIDGTCSVKPSHSESQYLALTADKQPECASLVLASGQRHRESGQCHQTQRQNPNQSGPANGHRHAENI